jgi:Rod binding domain-containing protein
MADATAINSAQNGLLDAQAARLLERFHAGASSRPAAAGDGRQDAKIEKSSKDFESILLGSWLQGAEQSFAKVPGGDEQDDDDTSKDQFQGIAMQALAESMTASGGIGIARMIAQSLRSAAQRESVARSS